MNFDFLIFRKAEERDLVKIIEMLFDDILGRNRENFKDITLYKNVFLEISNDKNNFLAVVEYEKEVIGSCHLTLMPSLTIKASKRMNIEAVRIDKRFTNKNIGSWMFKKVKEYAKENGVKIIQLTTDKRRHDAHRFYKKLGFEATHEGMKLYI